MIRRVGPLLWALLGITALLVSQMALWSYEPVTAYDESFSAAPLTTVDEAVSDTPVEPPVREPEKAFSPPQALQAPKNFCAVHINGVALLDDIPPGYPNYAAGAPWYGMAPLGILECIGADGNVIPNCEMRRNPGDELPYLFLMTNSTGWSVANGGCNNPGNLTDVAFIFSAEGVEYSITPNYQSTPGTLAPGQLAWAVVSNYTVPPTVDNQLDLFIWAGANSPLFPDIPGQYDAANWDDDIVFIDGPAIKVDSFTVNPAFAAPGEPVTFTLTVTNTRPVNNITGLKIVSDDPTNKSIFEATCHDPTFGKGNWKAVPGGTTITSLEPGKTAQCQFEGNVPSNLVGTTYRLVGDVSATDGVASRDFLIEDVTSNPVTVPQPQVGIAKRVLLIQRGVQIIYSGSGTMPPAVAGDIITYEIVVTNTGQLDLNHVWVVDSLTGVVPTNQNQVLAPAEQLVLQASYAVSSQSQDPLNNNVTVTADSVALPVRSVNAQASAVVDILDSALEIDLEVFNAATGLPITTVTPPATVEYQLTLRNGGGTEITNLQYVPVGFPLQTVGTPSAISPTTLAAGGELVLPRWTYAVNVGEKDPLVSTIRVRGTVDGTTLLYAQDQVTLDISTPGINIDVDVLEPIADAVLRGGDVVYEITVTNTDSASALCNVMVNQYLRDPDTGDETLITAQLPMTFPVTAGRLDPGERATGTTTYLVTAADKDPLDMIFQVTSNSNCTNPVNPPLTDRTSAVLDISDVQVNAQIIANLGPDGVAVVGDLDVEFTYVAQNVSAVTLENLTATWCVLHLQGDGFCPKQFDPGQGLSPTVIGSFESTSGKFTYPEIKATDAQASPFIVEVTLRGTDNQGNQVAIKTAKTIPIATPEIALKLTAPATAVIGDTIEIGYTITNASNNTLTNVRLYNLLRPLPGGGYEEVANFPTILGAAGQNVVTGTFAYTIDPSKGIKGTELTLTARVEGTSVAGPVLAVDSVVIKLIPILQVLKTGDEIVVAGETVNYSVLITNNSEDQIVNITGFTDTVLEGYGLGPFNASNFATWDPSPGVLGPGKSVRGNFQIPAVNPDPNPLRNRFEVRGTRQYDNAEVVGVGTHKLDIGCPVDVRFNVRNLDNEPDNILGEWYRWQITIVNRSQGTITINGINESLFWQGLVTPLNTGLIWPDPANPGVLGPGQSAVMKFPPSLGTFAEIQDNADTVPGDAFLESVSVQFAGAAVTECVEDFKYPVYSPILVTKIPSVGFAFVGEEISYTIILENLAEEDDAPYDYYRVTAYDPRLEPNPLEFEYSPGVVSSMGIMGPREMVSTTRPYIVKAGDVPMLKNSVTAEYPDPDPATADMTWFTSGSAEIGAGEPFKITKKPSVKQAVPGTTITYDYTITNNTTNYLITGITVVDDKIGDLIPGRTGSPLTLNPGQTFTGLIDVPYDVPLSAQALVTNTVTVTGTIQGREVSQKLTVSVPLIESEIKITKFLKASEGPPPGTPGAEIPGTRDPDGAPQVNSGTYVHYCFTVVNNGVAPTYVDDILIQDIMFPGVQAAFEQAVINTWNHDANPDMLIGGEGVELCLPRFLLTISNGMDPFVNLVKLNGTSSSGVAVYAEDTLSVDIRGTDLLVTKLPSPSLAYVGDPVTYTITMRNNVAANILIDSVIDTREGGSPVPIPVSAFSGWSTTPGTLTPGETVTYSYTYVLQPTDPDPLVNVATASGTIAGSGQEVFDSSRAVVAVTDSRLLVDKRATPDVSTPSPNGCEVKDNIGDDPSVPACRMISYRVTITNVSTTPDTVYNIYADDTHFDAETGQLTTLRFEGSALTDTSLDPYETAVIVYQLPAPTQDQLLANPGLDPFLNTITVYGTVDDITGFPLVDSEQSDSTESVDILQPNIRVIKTPQFGAAAPGQDVPYTVSITNVGGAGETLTSIRLTDLYIDPATGNPVTLIPQINLDTVCPNIDPAVCPFTYGPEPYIDRNGTPDTLEPNPLAGQPYDPDHGLQASERITGTITAPVPIPWLATEFTNIVQIDATVAPLNNPVLDRASATIDIRSAGINVSKSASVSTASIGTPVTYTVRVTNVGSQDITKLIIVDAGISQADDLLDGVGDGAVAFPNPTHPNPFNASGDPQILEPEEEFQFQYLHTLTVADGDPYVNTATVVGFTATGSVINLDQAVVDILGASIRIEKYVCIGDDTADDNDPSTFLPDCDPVATPVPILNLTAPQPHRLTYYLHITNPGAVPIYSINVTDTVGTVPAITWPYTDGNGTGLAGSDGATGGDDEIWVMYIYDVKPGDPDPLTNLVTVSGTPETGGTVQDTDSASVMLVTSDLQLTKTANVTQAQMGETITYTLTVQNLNPTDNITSVSIVDPLSGSATAICTFPTLLPGVANAQTCMFTHVVTAQDAAPLINNATATGTLDTIQISDTASVTVDIVSSGLLISKSANTNVAAIGDTVTFTYRIQNTGTTTITNLAVSDSDPALTFPAAPNPNAWPSFLTPGQVEVRTLTRTMQATDPDPYTNTMTVTGTVTTPFQELFAQVTETVYIANGDLVVSNTPNMAFALPGQNVTFTYVATNLGTETITGLMITDNRAEPGCPDYGPVDLGPGLSATTYCTVTAALPGPMVSTVTAQGTVPGPVTVSDTATASVEVTAGGLLVTKTPDMTVASPGDTVTFTVVITNISTQTLTNFNVVDTMYALSPAVPGNTLVAGAVHTMTGTYTVPMVNPPSSLMNTVTVTAQTDAVTPTVYQDSAIAVVAIREGPGDLVLTKAVMPQRALPGETVTYSLRVQNVGTSAATMVTLVDPALPGSPISLPDLAPGNVWNGTFNAVIPADWTQTTFVNTAEVYSDTTLQDTASATVTVDLLTLTKTANVSSALPGDSVVYTFTITNNSSVAIPNVSLVDPLINTWTPPAPLTDGTVDPGETTFTGALTLPTNWTEPTFDNTASLQLDGVDVATATVQLPVGELLTLTKTAIPTTGRPGDPITYTFTITNPNTFTIGPVSLVDPAITSWSPAALVNGNVSPGTMVITGTGTIPADFVPVDWNAPVYTNTAEMQLNGTPFVAASADVTVEVLALDKTANPATATPGDTITYTFTITNYSTATIPNVTLVDDHGTVTIAWTPPAPLTNGSIPTGTTTLTGTATIPANHVGTSFNNTATLRVGAVDVATDTVGVVMGDPLTLDKSAPLAAIKGNTITYTFIIGNTNSFDITNVTLLDDQIDAGGTWVNPLVNGTIAANSTVTVTATYPVPFNYAESSITNTATLQVSGAEVATDSATVNLTNPQPLTLDKTAPARVGKGQSLNYVFTINNPNAFAIPGITLSDPFITNNGVWDDPAPVNATIPPGNTIIRAHYDVAIGTTATEVTNTAALLLNNNPFVPPITDTVTTQIVELVIQATITGFTQRPDDQVLLGDDPDSATDPIEPLQTGKPITLTFRIENLGGNVITGLSHSVLDVTVAPGQTVGCQLLPSTPMPAQLEPNNNAAGGPDEATLKCRFTPQPGRETYRTDGLMRTLELTVRGTDNGPTADTADDVAVEAVASRPIELIDLLLNVSLTGPSSSPTPAGQKQVGFELTLTNAGASPIGCTQGLAACALQVAFDNAGLQGLWDTNFKTQLAGVVLQPEDGNLTTNDHIKTFTLTFVPTAALPRTISVVADGGFYRANLQTPTNLLSYYRTRATTTLEVPGLEVYVTANPNPPEFNKSVTYTVTVINSTPFTVTSLAGQYQITPLATAPQLNGLMLTGNSYEPAAQTGANLTFSVTSLAPNTSTTTTVSRVETNKGPYVFTAVVSGMVFVPQDVTARADVTLVPTGVPGTGTGNDDDPPVSDTATQPQVRKSPDVTTTQPGQRVIWTIRVRNGWTQSMTNMIVQDAVPGSFVIDSASTDRGVAAVNGQLITVTAGTLASDEDVNITVYTTVRDDAPAPGTLSNTACATYTGGSQGCATGTVTLGPGVGGLPATGIRTNGFSSNLGIVLAGALILLMAAQSNRRMLIAMLFVVIMIAVVVAGVAVLVMNGGDDAADPTDKVEVPVDDTPVPAENTPVVEPTAEVVVEFPPTPAPYVVSAPTEMPYLLIPKLGDQFEVPVPIVNLPIVNREWDVSGLGYYVGWLHGTTWMDPGWGNTVLAAHVQLGFNNPGPFWGLGELAPGDEIIVVEGDVEYRFEVVEIVTVDPSDWTVTAPTDEPTLTLITCTNWDQNYGVFSERMVVRAVPAGMANPSGDVGQVAG